MSRESHPIWDTGANLSRHRKRFELFAVPDRRFYDAEPIFDFFRRGRCGFRVEIAAYDGEMARQIFARVRTFSPNCDLARRLEPCDLVEHKEEGDVLSKWGNDLRQSYRTLAQAAGVRNSTSIF